MAGLAVLYAVVISAWLTRPYRDLGLDLFFFIVLVLSVIALPLAFRGVRGFRIACLTVATFLLPFGLVLAIGGMFAYWPAAVPLALAATSVPGRHFLPSLMVAGSLLVAAPWAYSTWVI
ncbi:hypothetical protein [Couchioplanes caeruleus]|nr:hypothetical protein [Couchioplanes caeruleus]ROP30303.1 hypothetical protein EDD30_3143 [Couchioplanes caeruleus]